jgi:hypothetical protein
VAVYNLFSKRAQDALRAGTTEVYSYDTIPKSVRNQIKRILIDGLGKNSRYPGGGTTEQNPSLVFIHNVLCREYGLESLGARKTEPANLLEFVDSCSTEEFLDILELGCRMLDTYIRDKPSYERERWEITGDADELLDEVNYRLRRAGLGYQYVANEIIRIDSQLLHANVVKPALTLLQKEGYSGPQAEFLSAYEHLRAGRHKEAVTDAAKSFESMMKAICDRKGWAFPKGARASDLLKVLRSNNLWPDYLDGSFDQLIATLASGLPQVRNDTGAHGQGSTPVEAPEYVAAYALHLAGAKIVLLGEVAAVIPDKR